MTDRDLESIVLIAHGSRDPQWREPFDRLYRTLVNEKGSEAVAMAYMEFASPTLMEAVEERVEKGVESFGVFPLFLSVGGHVSKDIPLQIEEVRRKHPEIEVKLLPALGEDDRFYAFIEDLVRDYLDRALTE